METLNSVFYGFLYSTFEYRGNPYQEEKLKLALRVQAESRAIIQVISDLKSPRSVAYVQQANIGNEVQVNNGLPFKATDESPPNKLLEVSHGQRLDPRKAGQAVIGDSSLEPVEAVHGATDDNG